MTAYTQAQLDALKAQMASGAKSVKFEGREVEYWAYDELRKRIDEMEAELSPSTSSTSCTFGSFSKD